MSGITPTSSPNALERVWNLEKPKSVKKLFLVSCTRGKIILLSSAKTWQQDGE